MNIQEFISALTPEDLLTLKESLGVRKVRAKKDQSPEFLAAKTELDDLIAENPEIIAKYEDAKEKLRGMKAVRKVLATRQYNLDEDTGEVTARDNGEAICVFDTEGWQSKMRAEQFTVGQCAAVSKKMRAVLAAPVAPSEG